MVQTVARLCFPLVVMQFPGWTGQMCLKHTSIIGMTVCCLLLLCLAPGVEILSIAVF